MNALALVTVKFRSFRWGLIQQLNNVTNEVPSFFVQSLPSILGGSKMSTNRPQVCVHINLQLAGRRKDIRSGVSSKSLEIPSDWICFVTCLLRTNLNEQKVKYADQGHMLYPCNQIPWSQMDPQTEMKANG